ncbi:MAG: integration host factor subunit beta [Bacteroidales bacterium]|nr:integration host factor subunit beta [Bacteroidales bacterium]
MTKSELITLISHQTGIDNTEVKKIVESLAKNIKDSLKNNNNVYLRGFGSFLVVKKAKKTARDIRKNKSVIIPEHFAPKFKPVKAFKDSIKENIKNS